jgi:hypothetical protein
MVTVETQCPHCGNSWGLYKDELDKNPACLCGWCGETRPPGPLDTLGGNHVVRKIREANNPARGVSNRLDRHEFVMEIRPPGRWLRKNHPSPNVHRVTVHGKKAMSKSNNFQIHRLLMAPLPNMDGMAEKAQRRVRHDFYVALEEVVGRRVTRVLFNEMLEAGE